MKNRDYFLKERNKWLVNLESIRSINTVTSVNAARPIRINSSTPIGVVGLVLLPHTSDGMSDENSIIYEKIKEKKPLWMMWCLWEVSHEFSSGDYITTIEFEN